jgi:hypothetical protein
MTLIEDRPTVSSHAHAAKKNTMGRTIVKWMTSTDPKVIGNLYLITSFIVNCYQSRIRQTWFAFCHK